MPRVARLQGNKRDTPAARPPIQIKQPAEAALPRAASELRRFSRDGPGGGWSADPDGCCGETQSWSRGAGLVGEIIC